MTLQPTYGYFEAIGKVTGINSDRAFSEGSKNDLKWNRLQFGLKVSKNSFLYVELMGNKTDKIRMYKNNSNDELEDNRYELVKWDDIYKHQYNHLKLPQTVKTNIGLQKDEKQKKLIAFDAVNYFKDNLRNNQTVLVKGLLQFDEYDGKIQEKLHIRSILEVDEEMYDDSLAKAYFNQEIVYMDLKDNQILSKIIKGSKDVEIIDYSFTTHSQETIDYLRNLELGSTLKLHGNINYYVPIEIVEGCEVIIGPAIRELEVTGGNTQSLTVGRYSASDLVSKAITTSPFEEEDEYGF